MNVHERFYTAVSGGKPDRVPTLPKIWLDLAAVLMNRSFKSVIENPSLAMETVVEAAIDVKSDGVRLFQFPNRILIKKDDKLYEVDDKGNTLGHIDIQGGFATRLNKTGLVKLSEPTHSSFTQFWSQPEPFINNLEDINNIIVANKSFYEEHFGKIQRDIIKRYGDKIALIGDCGPATLAYFVLLRGMQNALMDLISNPKLAHAAMEKGVAIAITKGKFNIDCGLDILRLNDSVANMSLISPEQFRQFIKPHIKTVCDELHNYNKGVKIYCHICGNVFPILNDIAEAGIDCIGPMDPLGGFTCGQAREIIGTKVALMGGVNTLSFIDDSPEKLIEESRRCIEQAGINGGYILGSGCALSRKSKKENIISLHEAAVKYGGYN